MRSSAHLWCARRTCGKNCSCPDPSSAFTATSAGPRRRYSASVPPNTPPPHRPYVRGLCVKDSKKKEREGQRGRERFWVFLLLRSLCCFCSALTSLLLLTVACGLSLPMQPPFCKIWALLFASFARPRGRERMSGEGTPRKRPRRARRALQFSPSLYVPPHPGDHCCAPCDRSRTRRALIDPALRTLSTAL